MRANAKAVFAVVIVILSLSSINVRGQETGEQTINNLRQQIQRLLTVELDETTPSEVRALNRNFIRARRAQLKLLLEKNIEALRKYQSSVGSSLTPEENAQLQTTLSNLEQEFQSLSGTTNGTANAADTPSNPDAANPSTPADNATNVSSAPGTAPANNAADPSPPATATPDETTAETTAPATPANPVASALAAPQSPQGTAGASTITSTPDALEAELNNDKRLIVGRILSARRARNPTDGARLFTVLTKPLTFAKILSLNVLPREQFVREIEQARVDKQVGGTPANAGSTSLVSKGSIPAILGFAVENGGLTRTGDGTTVTFRGNALGLFEALSGKGFIDSFEDDSLSARRLRKFSFGISYDTSRGDMPGTFVGNRQQLAGYTLRYDFKNDRDPRNERYANQWATLVENELGDVAVITNIIQNLFRTDPTLSNWQSNARLAIAAASDADVARVVDEQFAILQTLELSPVAVDAVERFSAAFGAYRRQRSRLLDIVANGPIFAVEYNNSRRPGLIDTSNFNFIYGTGVFEGQAHLTFNGAFTLFNASPGAGMSRIRDFDFALQFDKPFGDPRGFGQFILSFAGQYKRQVEDEMMSNGMMLPTRGDIATGNLKLDVPIKNFGIRFPLSLTFSNRTEFDLRQQIRGNFGFTFDPDILFAILNPFTRR